MYWQEWSATLKRELKLDTDPIAITFAGDLPQGATPPAGKLSVCQALKRAAEGTPATITAATCGCPGGLVSLGLGEMPAAGQERLVDFLVNKEKAFCSRAALHRGQSVVKAPVGIGRHVCFAPLGKAVVAPDLVAFVGRPGSLHNLIGFAGGSLGSELAGPACRTGVGYPLVSGNIGVSLLDFGARRLAGYAPEVMLLTVPFARMIGMMHGFAHGMTRPHDQSAAAVEREIDDLGPIKPV